MKTIPIYVVIEIDRETFCTSHNLKTAFLSKEEALKEKQRLTDKLSGYSRGYVDYKIEKTILVVK